MKNKLAKFISVKSIITILLTAVFCILAMRGTISSEQFLTIFTTVTAFYFGTQHEKSRDEYPSAGFGGEE